MIFSVLLSVKWAIMCHVWYSHSFVFKAIQCHCQGQSSVSPDVGCFWQEISAKQVLHCFPQHWWPPVRCSCNFATSQPEWPGWGVTEWGVTEWGVTEWGVTEWSWHFSSGFTPLIIDAQMEFCQRAFQPHPNPSKKWTLCGNFFRRSLVIFWEWII